MNRKLSTTLGFYNPSFFHINIGTNSAFEKFFDKDFSIFVHEYIHFLQDVCTIYGLNNMYVYSEYIRFATNKIYKSENKEFTSPITPKEDNQDNIFLNKRICKLTNGDTATIKEVERIIEITTNEESTGVSGSDVDSIECIIVTCIDNLGEEQYISFGAESIMENMAYMMEQMICNEYETSPDYPYSFAEKIVEFLYPELGADKLNILALCDSSLLYNNPGKVFVQYIQEMKSKGWLPTKPEDIYDQILPRKNTLNGGSIEITIEDNYKQLSKIVRNQVKGYFNDPVLFNDIRTWVDQLVYKGQEMRFKNKYFILDIARGGSEAFVDFVKYFGTPLISNRIGECTLVYPENPDGVEIGYFYAIGQIISFLESGNPKCELLSICTRYGNEIDNRCNVTPWERCRDKFLCPYAMLWKLWRLSDFKPKIM